MEQATSVNPHQTELFPGGSPDILKLIDIIASSKLTNEQSRRTFFRNSALADYANSLVLTGSPQDFAERVVADLLNIDKLDVFLEWLVQSDLTLEKHKQFIIGKFPSIEEKFKKTNIKNELDSARRDNGEIVVNNSEPVKFDVRVLTQFFSYNLDKKYQIHNFIENKRDERIFSICLAGKYRVVKRYIGPRLLFDLKSKGILVKENSEIPTILINQYNNMDENEIEAILQKNINEESQIFSFISVEFQMMPKKIIQETYKIILKILSDKQQNTVLVWYVDLEKKKLLLSSFKEYKKENNIADFSIVDPPDTINLDRLRNVVENEINEKNLPKDGIKECFEKIKNTGLEFFNAYTVIDEFITK